MTVVSNNKVIFCEGKEKSLDAKLLDRILERIPTESVTIIPSGSKFTFSIFAQGYFYPQGNKVQKYLIFRDRDFDIQPEEQVRLIRLQNSWLTHRACIENYLLDANLIHTYWQLKYREKQENPISKWGHKDSPGVEAISTWIEAGAKELESYQAVRWALGDLLQASSARSQITTTWTGGSGKLPDSLALQTCQIQAIELINQFKSSVSKVTEEAFNISLTNYQQKFSQPEFWQQKQYLVWFHGKDLQKAMQRSQSQYISLESFFNWAVTQIDITQFPDLIELETKIKQL